MSGTSGETGDGGDGTASSAFKLVGGLKLEIGCGTSDETDDGGNGPGESSPILSASLSEGSLEKHY